MMMADICGLLLLALDVVFSKNFIELASWYESFPIYSPRPVTGVVTHLLPLYPTVGQSILLFTTLAASASFLISLV